ncbi:ABC transporter permease [Desulfobacterales bacterium HSG16]|nr:ABC transporter permease [Desulfobacterales bacterium HSG16]
MKNTKSEFISARLAWRNIWRNKRRTILTLLTIIAGCSMIVLLNSLGKGGHDQMIEDAVALNTGHIQVHEQGYWDNMTIDYAFEPSDKLVNYLDSGPDVQAFSERVVAGGLLSFKDTTRGVIIQGIDPLKEKTVTNLADKTRPEGRFLKPGDTTSVVVGKILAKNTGLIIGDKLAIISQGFDGSIAAERFTVVGILESGIPEFDRELMLIPISQAKETFSMMGFVHTIIIRLKDVSSVNKVKSGIIDIISGEETRLEVMGWEDLMPELVQYIVMDDVGAYIFDFILFMVVAFGILNTIQMSVFERTREFGVMLSIGTPPGQIVSIVLIESAIITFFGIIIGIAVGWAGGYYLQVNPIDYSSYTEELAVWGVSTTLFPAKVTTVNIFTTSALTFVLGLCFSIFPAYRASKLNPIEALRQL